MERQPIYTHTFIFYMSFYNTNDDVGCRNMLQHEPNKKLKAPQQNTTCYNFCVCILDWIVLEIKYKRACRFSSCLFICNIRMNQVALWMWVCTCVDVWVEMSQLIVLIPSDPCLTTNIDLLLLFSIGFLCRLRDEDDKQKLNRFTYI